MNLYEKIFLFLYFILRNKKKNNIVFLSSNSKDVFGNLIPLKKELQLKGLTCYNVFGRVSNIKSAIRSAIIISKARIIIVDQANLYLKYIKYSNNIIVQVWHAAGIYKKFGMDTINPKIIKDVQKQKNMHGYYDYVICSSENIIKTYSRALNINNDKVFALGMPRITKLLEMQSQIVDIRHLIDYKSKYKSQMKKIILYCPSFREVNGKRNYEPLIDLEKFSDALPEGFCLGIRLHPRAPKKLKDSIKQLNCKRLIDLSNISQEMALTVSDYIITDYSSIIFDACCINKKILFYIPDWISYERGCYFRPPESVSFYNENELLEQFLNGSDSELISYSKSLFSFYCSQCNKNSISNISEFIINIY